MARGSVKTLACCIWMPASPFNLIEVLLQYSKTTSSIYNGSEIVKLTTPLIRIQAATSNKACSHAAIHVSYVHVQSFL